MRSYYNKNIPGQYQGVSSRLSVGLDSYKPANTINDSAYSDMLDVELVYDEALKFAQTASISGGAFKDATDNDGIILSALAIPGVCNAKVSTNGYALLVYDKVTKKWYISVVKDSDGSITRYEVTSYGLPVPADAFDPNMTDYTYSVSAFYTDAAIYICFTCDYSKELVYLDYTNSEVGSIELPFYPKRMVSHANRLFIADTGNAIWWCRAGDIFSWYGTEYDNDRLMTSTALADGVQTLTAQPDVPRPVSATVTAVGTADTLGTITFVGKSVNDKDLTETHDLIIGTVQTLQSYDTVTSATVSGHTAAGTADNIEIGVAPVSGGYVQDDAGYWTIESETSLSEICVLSNNLYIFALDNIYIFKGYSPETFTLNRIVADIGIKQQEIPKKWLATINNSSYFYNNGDIYEFNGYDSPRIISHSIETNGSVNNYLYGGIPKLTDVYEIVADNNNLYVYNAQYASHTSNYVYVFNFDSRTWWKRSSFSKTNSLFSTNLFKVQLVPLASTDDVVAFISVDATASYYDMYYILGHKEATLPYISTKCFNTNPSEVGSISDILISLQGTADNFADISLYISNTVSGSFTLVKQYANYKMTGDLQILRIPMPIQSVANQHHYRLKLQIYSTVDIYMYALERRFRTKGYSR